ncbi:hypothetical protein JYB87_10620 [Shewanella avicenniae]|uniref:Uncharacterized protein n=1 Tax=Shewanella avicenniae TaxID=2814294 RepID=A0ABX7QMV5_9GAMM|nr:hypothetical protein [Shewanella avicenniae]QSX32233.1 hypothetical protein JYB87_10620 [Shewanella avicenniae]
MNNRNGFYNRSLATIQIGVARADGLLSLYGDDISFEPLNKQVGLGPFHLQRHDIKKVRRNISRGEHISSEDIDQLELEFTSGEVYRFIVNDSDKWFTLLQPDSCNRTHSLDDNSGSLLTK